MAALTGLASRANRRALRLRVELVMLALAGLDLVWSALAALARPNPFPVDGLLFLGLAVLVASRIYSRSDSYLGPEARWNELFRSTELRPRVGRGAGGPAGAAVAARAMAEAILGFRWLPLASVVAASLLFRFYRLDSLPGELYGDIAIVHEYVDAVLRGHFPFFFALSTGPLYGYTVAPLVAVLGLQGYLTYKIASVVVSLFGIWFTFLFAREVSGSPRVGLLAGVLLATSSWYVVFSRLGNAQILIPAVVALSYFLLASGVRHDSPKRVLLGLVVSSLGLYLMPQTFVLPLAYLVSAAFFLPPRRMAILGIAMIVLLAPFALILRNGPEPFLSSAGYVGGKVEGTANPLAKIIQNTAATLLMFHVRGDPTFRSNPPGLPQLDLLSGILLVIGTVALLRRARGVGLPMLLVPVLILLVPANMVLNEPNPTPSASRSIGVLPFVALAMAAGVWWVRRSLRERSIHRAVIPGLVGLIVLANWVRYFDDYAARLPDRNTPFGKIIAATIDDLPANTAAVVYSCCWGEWGQPEPQAIQYVLRRQRTVQYVARGAFSCDLLALLGRDVYVVWDPREFAAPLTPATCDPRARPEVHADENGRAVFVSYSVRR